MNTRTGAEAWGRLDNARQALLTRWEKMASFTIPRVCRQSAFNEKTDTAQFDWQSVGAQAVNHVVNKMMMALFAPSRPFLRLTPSAEAVAELVSQNVPMSVIEEGMSEAEQQSMRELDKKGDLRPKLHQALLNMTVVGNACVYMPREDKGKFKVFYSRNWAVRRDAVGEVAELILREQYQFNDLDPKVQEALKDKKYKPDSKVCLYNWCERNDKHGYRITQWVDEHQLPDEFNGAAKDYEDLPYKVWAWSLHDGADYASGLVEDYYGDFAALSALSEAMVKGAILASEFRWLVNPTGQTKPEDLENSENGSALPGDKDDISLLESGKASDLAIVQGVAADYIRRIGQGFLLGSAVTRDAERVTAEEIRMQAQELEASLGGVYSRAAVEVQLPLGKWLLKNIGVKIKGNTITVSIVTGLDALSRSGDLDAIRGALTDIALLKQVEGMTTELIIPEILSTIMIGHGLAARRFVKNADQVAQEQAQRQEQEVNQAASVAGAEAGAAAAAEGIQQ